MTFITFLMARIGSGLWESSVAIMRMMISVSEVVRNAQPSDWSLARSLPAFTISPLCARATSPARVVTVMGWLFSATDEPVVE